MWAAKDDKYALFVHYDDDADSPREWDHLGKMICFHRRYTLGDKHSYGEPLDFLKDAYTQAIHDGGKGLVRYLKQKRARESYLAYNQHTHEWVLWEQNWWRPSAASGNPDYFVSASVPKSQLNSNSDFWPELLNALTVSDLVELLPGLRDVVLLPLYLYDHSGLTISTAPFSCPWDSGQVGWIYASSDTIRKEYGNADRESMATAERVLRGEVEAYDHYLQGDSWYYRLYEAGEEIDCCGGFLGDVEKCGIEEYLPEDAVHLLHELEWTECSEETMLAA